MTTQTFTAIIELVNAVGGLLLLFVTAGALYVAYYSTKAAERSADIAERALTEMERPYVVIDSRKMSGVAVHEQTKQLVLDDALKFAFINHGRSVAILTEFYLEPAESWGPDHKLPTPIVIQKFGAHMLPSGLAIGAGESLDWQAPFNSSDFAMHRGTTGPYLYHRGFIRYHDLLGSKYVTGFCLLWREGQFLIAGDEEHNYVRRDDDRV